MKVRDTYLGGGIRSGTVGSTVGEAAWRSGSGSGWSVLATEVSGSRFFVVLDDVIERQIQSCRHVCRV